MSDNLWYYSQEGKQNGPVPFTQLRELAQSARLRPNDLVWQPGMDSWTPASDFDGVIPRSPSVPPPVPASAGPAYGATRAGPSPFEERGRAFLQNAAEQARRLGRAGDQSETLPHVRLMSRWTTIRRFFSPS